MFSNYKMSLCRLMHKLTYMIHNKSNVWSSKSYILKSTNNVMKRCRIREPNTRSGMKLMSTKGVGVALQVDM